jgi:hypothetical protein
MWPERHRNDARAGLGFTSRSDELGVSSVNPIEVADHYDGRPAHSDAPPGLWRVTSNSQADSRS